MPDGRWLLLIHQTPPKPDYLRVKVRRRLREVGAVAIKNSVYALPASETAVEDFQWILREVVGAGGDASICRAGFVDGLTDAEVEALFERERKAEYAALLADVKALRSELGREPDGRSGELRARVDALVRRLDSLARIDYFGAPERHTVAAAIADLQGRLRKPAGTPEPQARLQPAPRARTWVTRAGIKVDRIASAWLIRRFLDPDATFRFVDPERYRHRSGELRFDMFEGEYTHEGDLCTFEVLLQRFLPDDPALRRIADSVHDLDVKDGRYEHPETPGISLLIEGIAAAHPDDETRLQVGASLLDALYARCRSMPPAGPARRAVREAAGNEKAPRLARMTRQRRQR